ncbi:MAG: VWA domain-containing protein [Desulfovibrionaceae bacterium]|jgi:Mg-chelatase subunit ChlD|nr:VWA domain-containing protein [Desulfovibrionaceae bacterium]
MARHDAFLRCLPLLADALGRSYGVQVHIGGDTAWTDGRVIHLPGLPVAADPTFQGLVRGYVDHEAAHIRHTDFGCLKGVGALERHVWNILEDWRVENRLAARYPGCRRNFHWLICQLFLAREAGELPQNPSHLLLNWLLLRVRSWDVPELEVRCTRLRGVLDGLWPDLVAGLEDILQRVRQSCPDSAACLRYAREVVAAIQAQVDADQQASGKRKTGLHPVPTGAAVPDANQEDQPERDDSRPAPSPTEGALDDLLAAPKAALPEGMETMLGRVLETMSRDGKDQGRPGITVAVPGHKDLVPLKPEELGEARRITAGMRARLQGLLQARQACRCVPSSHGRVASGRLYRLAVQDTRVFLREGRRTAMHTAAHILLDCSGSMSGRIGLAGRVCHVLARTLERVGVNVAVTAFPADADDETRQTVAPLVRHGQPVHSRFRLAAKGRTPMGEAVWWALLEMVPLRDRRKLLLVVTDGKPDDSALARQAFAAARQAGVELYGLGINATGIRDLIPTHTIIKHMQELAPALFQLLGHALCNPTRRKGEL